MDIRESVIKLMKEQFNVALDTNRLSHEASLLYIEELDTGIFSPGVLRVLPPDQG
ncbi:hypothetical protein [Bacillus safensis]|uniref:hypothetical protein n=1 Tax=Bacillus safensis TaxID=561879 RepID=UPI002452A9FC|nr:hypothetical protein [Bacillus safensis]MDH3094452.1 hypothetical protein [Bacillus safensis]